ncbi:response regulator transcription factor [Niabella hibiscisoli]|uniref:response regulator transcription factor n=1 Tax=Niabella hibiscisoli TaxID=1825928 RepID=UPI001F0F3563|nr:response regulator [Niabella hibiscisoli]MCH5718774.1 response regulator [Niabella hibiscisoli]
MKKKKILIVEDNNDIRELIGFILTGDYYILKMCATAAALNAEMSRTLPDVIVLDIMLPDGNGLELCRHIKHDPSTSHVPVVLMSAHENEWQKDSGADSFIAKPFNIGDFKSVVESYL